MPSSPKKSISEMPLREGQMFADPVDAEFGGARHRLVRDHSLGLGYWTGWTEACTGCTERGDYGTLLCGDYDKKTGQVIGIGCSECGHTGKRRRSFFVQIDPATGRHIDLD